MKSRHPALHFLMFKGSRTQDCLRPKSAPKNHGGERSLRINNHQRIRHLSLAAHRFPASSCFSSASRHTWAPKRAIDARFLKRFPCLTRH
ncbi:hypothetical protein BDW68DRAFT_166068 [Aspergillus falconensis]